MCMYREGLKLPETPLGSWVSLFRRDRILLPGKEGSIHALMETIGRWKCDADDDNAEVGDDDRILLPGKEGERTCFDGNDRGRV